MKHIPQFIVERFAKVLHDRITFELSNALLNFEQRDAGTVLSQSSHVLRSDLFEDFLRKYTLSYKDIKDREKKALWIYATQLIETYLELENVKPKSIEEVQIDQLLSLFKMHVDQHTIGEYQVIAATFIDDFNLKVNQCIAEGYLPLGNVIVNESNDTQDYKTYFYQSMYRPLGKKA